MKKTTRKTVVAAVRAKPAGKTAPPPAPAEAAVSSAAQTRKARSGSKPEPASPTKAAAQSKVKQTTKAAAPAAAKKQPKAKKTAPVVSQAPPPSAAPARKAAVKAAPPSPVAVEPSAPTRKRRPRGQLAKTGRKRRKTAPVASPKTKPKDPDKRHKPPVKGFKKKSKQEVIPAGLLDEKVKNPAGGSGPGNRYDLGAGSAHPPKAPLAPGNLPTAYGTGDLVFAARDPHWIFAYWDLTTAQLNKYCAQATSGRLVLRVYQNGFNTPPVQEIELPPKCRSWFVNVVEAGRPYLALLGYYNLKRQWVVISQSDPTFTPTDTLADDVSARFATIPAQISLPQLLGAVKSAVAENIPLVEAVQQMRERGHEALPEAGTAGIAAAWTAEQEMALEKVVSMDKVRRVWLGSLEITELVRQQLARGVSEAGLASADAPTSPGLTSLSSPFGGLPAPRGFWFNVNAELIIYGATEPDARVTIGGREITLRADGSFSFRFALPDGEYALPAVAESADGQDTRSADLHFRRKTDYSGEVGAHPQDPTLKPPKPEHLG